MLLESSKCKYAWTMVQDTVTVSNIAELAKRRNFDVAFETPSGSAVLFLQNWRA